MKLFERVLNDRLLAWGTALICLLAAVPLAYGAISDHVQVRDSVVQLRDSVSDIRKAAEDRETRLRKVEECLAGLHVDVKWLRDHEEAREKR